MLSDGVCIFLSNCERFSTGLHWIGQSVMLLGVMFHILDDFLIVAQTKYLTDYYMKTFLHICKEIGIPMAPGKTIGPDTSITF